MINRVHILVYYPIILQNIYDMMKISQVLSSTLVSSNWKRSHLMQPSSWPNS